VSKLINVGREANVGLVEKGAANHANLLTPVFIEVKTYAGFGGLYREQRSITAAVVK
jgi:hypothetical protein